VLAARNGAAVPAILGSFCTALGLRLLPALYPELFDSIRQSLLQISEHISHECLIGVL
jgi:hypothetical protein